MTDRLLSISNCVGRVRGASPIVHCITNFVTVNDCANIILAVGGSPTMSRHRDEVGEIQSGCSALVLNMGAVDDLQAMLLAGKTANELGHPVVLDPVGAGASSLRRSVAAELLSNIRFAAIRGNASEIRFLAEGRAKQAGGIDADISDRITASNIRKWAALAKKLAAEKDSIVCISGVTDIIADSRQAFAFSGGCRLMSRITGSGCMLSSLLGCFLGAMPEEPLKAAVCAQAVMNAAGDIALEKTERAGGGTMSFRMHLIDAVSLMTGETLNEYAKIEELP